MKRNVIPGRMRSITLLSLLSLVSLLLGCLGVASAQSYTVVYTSNFATSEESQWTTNSPQNFRWDVANQRYRYYPYMPATGAEEYSYASVAQQGGSFRLEIDAMATMDNGGYFSVGLSNTVRMNEGSRIGFAYEVNSGASFFALEAYNYYNQVKASYGGSFVPGQWYHHTLIYDASTGSALYAARTASNEVVANMTLTNVGPFAPMGKIYALTVNNNASPSEVYLDGVRLSSGGPPLTTLTANVNSPSYGYVTPSSGIFEYGSALNVTASPYLGYRFSHWSGDVYGTSNPLTVYMIGSKNITANFVRDQKTLAVNVSPSSAGSVSPSGGVYDYGASVTLTAIEWPGYKFAYWSGDLYSTLNPLTVSMTDNRNLTANYIKQQFTLNTVVAPFGAGSIAPSSGTYDYGRTVSITAAPGPGYRFLSWSGDVSGATNPVTITMTSNKNVVANFVKPQVTLSTSVSPAGSGSVTPTGGTYDYGSTVAISTIAAPGYHFSSWSGDLSGSTNPVTVTMTANKNIVANFTREDTLLTVQVTPAGSGTIVPGGGTFQYGSSVALTAISSPGYRFSRWSGDISGTGNPVNLIMNGSKNVIANFIPDTSFVLSYSNGFNTASDGNWVNNNPSNFFWDSANGWYRFKLVAGSGEFAYVLIPTINGSFRLEADVMATVDTGTSLSLGLGNTVNLGSGTRIGAVAWNTTNGPYFVVEAQDSANQSRTSDGGTFRQGQVYKYTLSYDTNINTATLTVRSSTGEVVASLSRTGVGSPGNIDRVYLSTIGRDGAGSAAGYIDNIKVYTSGPVPVNLNVSTNPVGAGRVAPASGAYDYGVSLTLTASAAPGYRFASWSGDISGTTNPLTVNLTENLNIIANFAFDKSINLVYSTGFSTSTESQLITNNAANFGWDPVSQRYRFRMVAGTADYAYAAVPQITGSFRLETDVLATVDYGSHLSFGLGDTTRLGQGSRIGVIYYNNVGGTYFVLETANSSNQIRVADGGSYTQGEWYRHILTYDASKDTATLIIVRLPGEIVATITRSNVGLIKPMDRVYISTVDRGQMGAAEGYIDNIRLYFIQTSYANLSTTVSPAGGGTIAPSAGVYDYGASITLTAVPSSAKYKFSGWSGDASGITNPLVITMDTSKNITANFTPVVTPPPNPPAGSVPVAQAMSSVSTMLNTIWGYDYLTQTWTLYDPSIPAVLNDLAYFEKGKGYLISVKSACVLTYGQNTYQLGAGWNLIGWLG